METLGTSGFACPTPPPPPPIQDRSLDDLKGQKPASYRVDPGHGVKQDWAPEM